MYRTILVPLDGSAFGEYALPLALSIARRAGATVQLVHACKPPTPAHSADGLPAPVAPAGELGRDRASSYLTELATYLSPRWEVAILPIVLDGPADDTLYTQSMATGVDLVVMTTHGYGPLSRMWMGSVADKLVRRLPMPVLLTRPHAEALDLLEEVHEQAFEHMLIPLDGSALAEEVIEPAVALGGLMGARYTLLQAIPPVVLGYAPAAQVAGLDEQVLDQWLAEAGVYLDQIAERLRGQGPLVDTRVIIGPPAFAILDYARDHAVDLIALATHGRGGVIRLLLGSVADKVVRGAGVPVLIQRPHAETAEPPIATDRTAGAIAE